MTDRPMDDAIASEDEALPDEPETEGQARSEQEIARRIDALAAEIAPHIDDETVCVCLLTGGIWFSADLMRALARQGVHPLFDALWLTSYGHGR